MSGFRFRLVDLAPTDGIAPSLVFDPIGLFRYYPGLGSIYRSNAGVVFDIKSVLISAADWQTQTRLAVTEFGRSSIGIVSEGTAASTAISASGLAKAPALPGQTPVLNDRLSTWAVGGMQFPLVAAPFTLSANTQVVVTVDFDLQASASGGAVISREGQVIERQSQEADASVSWQVFGEKDSRGNRWNRLTAGDETVSARTAFDAARGVWLPAENSKRGTVDVIFANSSGSSITGVHLRVNAGSTTYGDVTLSPISAIPEPASAALMLAGLLGIALRGRRSLETLKE